MYKLIPNVTHTQYYREVWHYNGANTELIRRAVDQFNWQKAFLNKNVNEKVNILNETILNIPNSNSNYTA